MGDHATALPDGQRSAPAITFARLAYLNLVDRDGELISTNGLPVECQHALQHRNATRQIAAFCKECCEGFWRFDYDELGDGESGGGPH